MPPVVRCAPSLDSRIVPPSPTAHSRLPSLVPNTDRRSFVVGPVRAVHCTPSLDSRIVPLPPTAHSRLPSLVPNTDRIEVPRFPHAYTNGAVFGDSSPPRP